MRPLHLHHYRFFFTVFQERLDFAEPVDELLDFDRRHRIIMRRHIALLGWWSVLHLLLGIGGMWALSPGFWHYFFMMGMVWGLINFAVSMWIVEHAFLRKFREGSSFERFEIQRHIERLMLLNIGLDIAYIFAGLYIQAVACQHPVREALWQGLGWSVVLQGGFLFLLDNYFFRLHRYNFRRAKPFLAQLLGIDPQHVRF